MDPAAIRSLKARRTYQVMSGLVFDDRAQPPAAARASQSSAPGGTAPGIPPAHVISRAQSAGGQGAAGGATLDAWFTPVEVQEKPPAKAPDRGRPGGIERLIAAGLVEEYDLVGARETWHVYRCTVCGCGPWADPAHVLEHFRILGEDRAEHLRRYRSIMGGR